MSNIPNFTDVASRPPVKGGCSCGGIGKLVGTIDGEPRCGKCIRNELRYQRRYPNGSKRSKYGVDTSPEGRWRRTVDGIVFHSEGEAKRYVALKFLQKQGYIRMLERQPVYPITINGFHICNVVLDFRYFERTALNVDDWARKVEDWKGKDTPLSRLKRKLVEAAYPGTKVKVTK